MVSVLRLGIVSSRNMTYGGSNTKMNAAGCSINEWLERCRFRMAINARFLDNSKRANVAIYLMFLSCKYYLCAYGYTSGRMSGW